MLVLLSKREARIKVRGLPPIQSHINDPNLGTGCMGLHFTSQGKNQMSENDRGRKNTVDADVALSPASN